MLNFPPASLCVASKLYINSSITLRGAGINSGMKQKSSTSGNLLNVIQSATLLTFRLEMLTLDGNYASQSSESTNALVYMSTNTNSTNPSLLVLEECTILNPSKAALQVNGAQISPPTARLQVSNSHFYGGSSANFGISYTPAYIYVYDGVDVSIVNSVFDGLSSSSLTRSAAVIYSNNATYPQNSSITITGCTLANLITDGIGAVDFYAWGSNCIINGNRFKNCGSATIAPIKMKTSACGVDISDNVIEGAPADCIDVTSNTLSAPPFSPPLPSNLVITGNNLKRCGNRGINIAQSGGAGGASSNIVIASNNIYQPANEHVLLQDIDGVDITGNVFEGGSLALNVISGSGVYPSKVSFTNNVVTNTTNYGVSVATTTDIAIRGNYFDRVSRAAASIVGASSLNFADNTVTEVIASGGAAVVVRHQNVPAVYIIDNAANPCTTCTDYSVNIGGSTVIMEQGNSWNGRRLQGTAPPVSGTFAVGDIVWNSAQSYGAALGWVCIVAGTPGTWGAFAQNSIPVSQASATSAVQWNVNGGPSFEVLEALGGGASATSYVAAQGGTTFVRSVAAGTATNIAYGVDSKGSSSVFLRPASVVGFEVPVVASAVNWPIASPAAAGGVIKYGASGSDTNIETRLESKGSDPASIAAGGVVQFSCTSSACNSVVALQQNGVQVVSAVSCTGCNSASITSGTLNLNVPTGTVTTAGSGLSLSSGTMSIQGTSVATLPTASLFGSGACTTGASVQPTATLTGRGATFDVDLTTGDGTCSASALVVTFTLPVTPTNGKKCFIQGDWNSGAGSCAACDLVLSPLFSGDSSTTITIYTKNIATASTHYYFNVHCQYY